MTDQRCENCRFWLPSSGDYGHHDIGACRRYPEGAVTNQKHWCGEWQGKDAKQNGDTP